MEYSSAPLCKWPCRSIVGNYDCTCTAKQDVEKNYRQKERAISGPDQLIDFEADRIRLDIPEEGAILKEGWKLTPLFTPVVSTLESL